MEKKLYYDIINNPFIFRDTKTILVYDTSKKNPTVFCSIEAGIYDHPDIEIQKYLDDTDITDDFEFIRLQDKQKTWKDYDGMDRST